MAKAPLPYSDYKRVVGRALDAGAVPSANGSLQWDISNGCQQPLEQTVKYSNEEGLQHRYLVLNVRCRKCDPCRKARADLWRMRMDAELRTWPRSWFVTLTLAPEWQSYCRNKAELDLRRRATKWHEASAARQFSLVSAVASKEVTLWLKRMRERSGAPLRYSLVWEQHKSGLPHAHVLIHEVDPDRPVRHRHIVGAWRWGFVNAKLVPEDGIAKASNYVAKYLSKSLAGRVRASRGYGRSLPDMTSCQSD